MKENAAWSCQYGQPTSKPRVCNSFDTPLFNIGMNRIQKWVRISKYGEISQSEKPQEFVPQSYNKEEQIVTRQSSIYSTKQ